MADNLALRVRDLKTYFFTKRGVGKAVDGVSFDLRRGETLGLVGESGCGKSLTSLSLIRLNPKPASRIVGGQVLLDGEDLLRKSDDEIRRYRGRHIAMILQDPMTALNPVFTIANQLYEPLRLHQGLGGRPLRQRAIELLRMLRIPAPESRLSSYPHQFSGGMRQRTVGAIALSCSPEVLIADEPTTSLDVTIQAAILDLLKDIQRQTNLAILFITHDFGVVARMCERVAVMYAGRIIETADTASLFEFPAHPYTEALLDSVPDVSAQIKRLYSIEGQPPSIYNLTGGCSFAARCPHVHGPVQDAIPAGNASGRQSCRELLEVCVNGEVDGLLQAIDLKKHFSKGGLSSLGRNRVRVRAVDGISFSVRPRETFSLVGESGCGKTTTAKVVLLLEKPTAGVVHFEGRDISRLNSHELRRYRASMQAVFQDPWSSLNPRMRVGSIIAEPLVVNQRLPKQEIRERVQQLLLDVGLEPVAASNYPHEFSGGQRQRIALARALALNPRIIVLDEPVSALDVSIRAQIMNLLKDLQDRYGISYFLIAHNLATVRYLSHQVAVMYLGLIVEQAGSEEIFTKPLHPYTKALLSAALPARPGQQQERIVLSGEVPSPADPPSGCRFRTRCPHAFDRCAEEVPQLRELAPGHTAACHLY